MVCNEGVVDSIVAASRIISAAVEASIALTSRGGTMNLLAGAVVVEARRAKGKESIEQFKRALDAMWETSGALQKGAEDAGAT